MVIHKIVLSEDLKHLDTQLYKPSNPKKTLGTSVKTVGTVNSSKAIHSDGRTTS